MRHMITCHFILIGLDVNDISGYTMNILEVKNQPKCYFFCMRYITDNQICSMFRNYVKILKLFRENLLILLIYSWPAPSSIAVTGFVHIHRV